jgi:hypothetical protein
MITFTASSFISWHSDKSADRPCDCGLGNMMFFIAGTIGIAVKNGYDYGFFPWKDQRWFENPLPMNDIEYPQHMINWGFNGFDVPDNVSVYGYMQTDKYFEHCKDLIRHYFTLKPQGEIIKDTLLIHYRAYDAAFMYKLKADYYQKAIGCFPKMNKVVITDNIERAREVLGNNFGYISSSPIRDFWLMANADNLIISNSTFAWWAAWLSQARIVAPCKWMAIGEEQSSEDIYCKEWIKI